MKRSTALHVTIVVMLIVVIALVSILVAKKPCTCVTPAPFVPLHAPTTSLTSTSLTSEIRGWYKQTQSRGSTISLMPADTNTIVFVSGKAFVSHALDALSANVLDRSFINFLGLGGSTEDGMLTRDSLLVAGNPVYLNMIRTRGFNGICFDMQGVTPGLDFNSVFQTCKQANFQVMVIPSASVNVQAMVKNSNIDIISPRLYTGTSLDLNPQGLQLSTYRGAKPKIVPTIIDVNQYSTIHSYFNMQGIQWNGYFVAF